MDEKLHDNEYRYADRCEGRETGRPLGKIFHREYVLGVSVELFNEH